MKEPRERLLELQVLRRDLEDQLKGLSEVQAFGSILDRDGYPKVTDWETLKEMRSKEAIQRKLEEIFKEMEALLPLAFPK